MTIPCSDTTVDLRPAMGQESGYAEVGHNVLIRFDTGLLTPPASPIKSSRPPLRVHCNLGDPFLDTPPHSPDSVKDTSYRRDSTALVNGFPYRLLSTQDGLWTPSTSPSENIHPVSHKLGKAIQYRLRIPSFVSRESKPANLLLDDEIDEFVSTPCLTPDVSPQRPPCQSSRTSLAYTRGNLDGEVEDSKPELEEDDTLPVIPYERVPPPPLPVFPSSLNKRLRATQRPFREHEFASSPTRTSDRFVIGRSDIGHPRQQWKLGKLPSRLLAPERTFRRRFGRSDPFNPQGRSRMQATDTSSTTGIPSLMLQPSRLRADSNTGQRAVPFIDQRRRVSPSSVWNTGGSAAATGSQPITSADIAIMPVGRNNAPIFTSRFIDDVRSDNGRALHEKRLALAFGIDSAEKILSNPSNLIGFSGSLASLSSFPTFIPGVGIPTYLDAGYGDPVWEDNTWIKKSSIRSICFGHFSFSLIVLTSRLQAGRKSSTNARVCRNWLSDMYALNRAYHFSNMPYSA